MTECAHVDCSEPRLVGNRGTESYCRRHKNEMAYKIRHAGQEPEVTTAMTCQRVGCDNTFVVSSWGRVQRYCGEECRKGAPKAARAAARAVRKQARAAEEVSRTHKFCPGVPARGDEPAQTCGNQPIEAFYVVKGRLDTACKVHRRETQRRYDEVDPGRRRDQKMVSQRRLRMKGILYGDRQMNEQDWDREFIAQGARCLLCLQEFTVLPDVDHDHQTMQFRGLLCRRDNIKCHDGEGVAYASRLTAYYERTPPGLNARSASIL